MDVKFVETELGNIVDDFDALCRYLCNNEVILTKSCELLGKKDLFNINLVMTKPKLIAEAIYQQESYPCLYLLFNLAIVGKLFIKELNKKNRFVLKGTEKLVTYNSLNQYEKYISLLETYWKNIDFGDFDRINKNYEQVENLAHLLIESSEQKPGTKIIMSDNSKSRRNRELFRYGGIFVFHLAQFGLWEFEEGEKLFDLKNHIVIKSLTITKFGVEVSKVLFRRRLIDWNKPYLRSVFTDNIDSGLYGQYERLHGVRFENGEEISDKEQTTLSKNKKKELFFEAFVGLFPENKLEKVVAMVNLQSVVVGTYTFKVSMSKKVWRRIAISSKSTLEDLHYAILDAYGFDEDNHLYSFFMDGKKYSNYRYNSPNDEEGPFVDEAKIGKIELYIGQRVLYLFDYGDSWQFSVVLEGIRYDGALLIKPVVIELLGEAPIQYNEDYDEYYF